MHILLTNDDGIDSDGLRRLADAAQQFGDVWIIAPAQQRSAASHSITLHSPLDVYPFRYLIPGIQAFTCSGTPADCVRIGCTNIMPQKPDAVLSGINYGYNVASDIQYSGTVGAAFEAAFQGCLAIAVSEAAVPCHEIADAFLKEILGDLLKQTLSPNQVFNVNFPGGPLSACRGILYERTVSLGAPYRDHYVVTEKLPSGGVRLMVEGVYDEESEAGSDLRAVAGKYISVSKLSNIM